MEEYKDIQIGEFKYRIYRLTARNGSWIVAQIATKILPSGMEGMLGVSSQLPANRQEMTESEFHNIQDHCLRVCSRHDLIGEQPTYTVVLRGDGRFSFPDLEFDALTVVTLTVHALLFSCGPFFSEGALKLLMGPVLELFQGSSLSNASK